MPHINAQFSARLDDAQKDSLQKKLSDAVSKAFSKPKAYIMVNIEDGKSLYMAEKKMENGAYIAVRLLGTVSKADCQPLTKEICDFLHADLALDGTNVYITYHPVDLWGWNNTMF